MSEIAPWLVVGGASLIVVCAVGMLGALASALRRTRRRPSQPPSARAALAAGDAGLDDDELMPLLLGAVRELTRADAAVVTFVRPGDRRRSYGTGLHVAEARSAIDALVAFPAEEAVDSPRNRVVVPIDRPGLSGALALYWQDERPSEFDTADVEALVDLAVRRSPRPTTASVQPVAAAADERRRWSWLADLNGTLEPAPLLRKIVDAVRADCGADAAAAQIGGPGDTDRVSEAAGFAEHEGPWVQSVLAPGVVVPSITRYIVPRGTPAEGREATIGTAIVVPLRDVAGAVIGTLVAVWRRDLADEGDRQVAWLERLLEDARAALGNASRFQRLQSAAERDATTGLFDRRSFSGLLADAVERARHPVQPLALLLFAAAEVEPASHDVRVQSLEETLVDAARRIAAAAGSLGVTCRVGLGEFAVILPETDAAAAERLLEELGAQLPAHATDDARLTWSASAVELEEGEGHDGVWERARRALRPQPVSPVRAKPVTTPVVSGPMRLSVGERGDDWTLRARAPRDD